MSNSKLLQFDFYIQTLQRIYVQKLNRSSSIVRIDNTDTIVPSVFEIYLFYLVHREFKRGGRDYLKWLHKKKDNK